MITSRPSMLMSGPRIDSKNCRGPRVKLLNIPGSSGILCRSADQGRTHPGS